MSAGRFAAYAVLAAGLAALLLYLGGELGTVGVVLIAVVEALAVAAIVRRTGKET